MISSPPSHIGPNAAEYAYPFAPVWMNTLALTFPEYVMENKPIEEYKAAGLSVAVFPLCKDGSTDC